MNKTITRYKFGFVILHYLSFEMTALCVNQLLNFLNDEEIEIVVVDNGSNNGSVEELEELFKKIKNVHIIKTGENLGFANGNNVGYSYLKRQNDIKFIIIMNNDILINQKDILGKITDIYQSKYFDILGPDIYSLAEDIHQNPLRLSGYKRETVDLLIRKYKARVKVPFLYYIKSIYNRRIGKQLPSDNVIDRSIEYENPVLHGAFYVFSNKFIIEQEYAFCPDTFLYGEEDILYLNSIKNGYKQLYSPLIKVTHLEHISTIRKIGSYYKRMKFVNKQALKSLIILRDNMQAKGCRK